MLSNGLQISHLFTVRVWLEKLSEDVVETRFQAKHITSGESRLFRDGDQLLAYLRSKAEVAEEDEVNQIVSANERE
jgi:hypothetical protein